MFRLISNQGGVKRPPEITQSHRPRLYYIDNLRVLACFLVLLTHSTMPARDPEKEGFWMFLISFIGSPSSELFLTLSGTVLLPSKSGFSKFYSRRFAKLVPPLVIWSILGVILYVGLGQMSWSQGRDAIFHIPLRPAIGIYWFVYVMAGLYLLAPFISPWLREAGKRQIEFFLMLWGVNMLIPWINQFFPDFLPGFAMNGNYYWMLSYFGGFLGYWILGYYLNKYPIKPGWNCKCMMLVCLTVAYPLAIYILKTKGCETQILLDNLQMGSALVVASLYTIMQNLHMPDKIQRALSATAKYSFCIYLTHIYIARQLYWGLFDGSEIHIFPRTFIIALMTLITGYCLTWVIARLPKGKYIAGT